MRHRLLLVFIIALSTLIMGAKAAPRSSLEGSWKGAGTISAKSGTDRVLCRARVRKSGAAFSFSATCTTESGRYELSGTVRSAGGGRYSGTVQAGGKGSGKVQISQSGRRASVTATGGGGSARLNLSKL